MGVDRHVGRDVGAGLQQGVEVDLVVDLQQLGAAGPESALRFVQAHAAQPAAVGRLDEIPQAGAGAGEALAQAAADGRAEIMQADVLVAECAGQATHHHGKGVLACVDRVHLSFPPNQSAARRRDVGPHPRRPIRRQRIGLSNTGTAATRRWKAVFVALFRAEAKSVAQRCFRTTVARTAAWTPERAPDRTAGRPSPSGRRWRRVRTRAFGALPVTDPGTSP